MKHSDFSIGLIFHTVLGRWKCTDVGQRTIVAIHLDNAKYPNEPRWTDGPPYGLKEEVFNEHEIARAYTDLGACIAGRMADAKGAVPLLIPGSMVGHHMRRKRACREAERLGGEDAYPTAKLAGVRISPEGQHYSAHGAHRVEDAWQIEVFHFELQQDEVVPEDAWLAWTVRQTE